MASKSYTLLEYLVTMENQLKDIKIFVENNVGTDYIKLITQINSIGEELNTFKISISDIVNNNNTNLTTKLNSLEQQYNTFKTSITNTVNTNNSNLLSQLDSLTSQFNEFKTSITNTVNSNKTTLENKINSFNSQLGNRVTNVENRVSTLESNAGNEEYGEKLIAHYTHTGNKEIYFSSFDFKTCIGKTSQPHGLTDVTEVIIVPNDWSLKYRYVNVKSIPIEWVTNNDKIKLVPVDNTTLKLTKNDGTTLIPVNISDSDNQDVDITKFHFEVPVMWSISNFPVNTNYVRIVIKGHTKGLNNRYFNWKTKNNNDVETVQSNIKLSIPPKPNSNSTHALFGVHSLVLDFRDEIVTVTGTNFFEGRKANSSSFTWNSITENICLIFSRLNGGKDSLSYLSPSNSSYSVWANNSHVYIYDLGGDY